ncbi:MAG: glycosyltransferase family 2 protein [Bacteroidetes bacterium]|nr:glycosyltransferase family 2 protein [Bacteroidota bacterium]
MKISIIITSWNTQTLLRACLHSIFQFPPKDKFEVIVVDNNSRDGSAEMVEIEFPDVRLIKNNENTGYAKGNNIGYTASTGSYILLLGSDTQILYNAVNKLSDFLDTHHHAGIVSGKLLLSNGLTQHSCKKFPTLANAAALYCSLNFLNKAYLMADFNHNEIKEIDQPDATCIMIRRTALTDYIFNEQYSILYNDVELCKRIKTNGWKIYFLPDAEIVHHGSQSTKQANPQLRLVMYKNIIDYYSNTSGYYSRYILKPILIIRFLLVSRSFLGLKLLFY